MSELRKVLQRCEENWMGKVRDSYSGRFMYGERCIGFDTNDPDAVQEEVIRAGFSSGRIDNMGLGWILYWPGEK